MSPRYVIKHKTRKSYLAQDSGAYLTISMRFACVYPTRVTAARAKKDHLPEAIARFNREKERNSGPDHNLGERHLDDYYLKSVSVTDYIHFKFLE